MAACHKARVPYACILQASEFLVNDATIKQLLETGGIQKLDYATCAFEQVRESQTHSILFGGLPSLEAKVQRYGQAGRCACTRTCTPMACSGMALQLPGLLQGVLIEAFMDHWLQEWEGWPQAATLEADDLTLLQKHYVPLLDLHGGWLTRTISLESGVIP